MARGLLSLLLLAAVGASAGCAGGARAVAAPTTAASPAQAAGDVAPGETIRVSGMLTLKGSDFNAWWALLADDGVLWRLETADPAQVASFRQWQNTRIEVAGARNGMALQVPVLKVVSAQRTR